MSKVTITIEERELQPGESAPPAPPNADPIREPVPIRYVVDWDPPFDTDVPVDELPQTHQMGLIAINALRNDPLTLIDTMTAHDEDGTKHVRYRKGGQG